MDLNRDMYRTQLCFNGPTCRRARCHYAHSLGDLLEPDETRLLYTQQWHGHDMDRFSGQSMSGEQIERIRLYSFETSL